MVDLSSYLASASKIFLAPNTSDQELVDRAKKRLAENGIQKDKIEVNYDLQLLSTGDLYISYDPPDLVVRVVYEKKLSGMVKMKSATMIKL
jgi:undecaprenyl pyrophosphate synthase